MNATARTARATIRQRTNTTHAAARINRRGDATLTTHAIAAGLTPRQARSVAGSLRTAAKALDLTGRTVDMHVKRRPGSRRTQAVTAHRYTRADVALMAAKYRPRIAAYRVARTHLLALAAQEPAMTAPGHDRDCCCITCEPGDEYTAAELASFANPDNWPNEQYPYADRFGEDIRQFG